MGQEAVLKAADPKAALASALEPAESAPRTSVPRIFRGTDGTGGTVFYELFEWRDAEAPNVAHQSPAVMAVWEPMGELCEEREGRPKFEFPHVEPVTITYP